MPIEQQARATKPLELGGPIRRESIFPWPLKKGASSDPCKGNEAAAPITRGGRMSNRIVPPVEQAEPVRPEVGLGSAEYDILEQLKKM